MLSNKRSNVKLPDFLQADAEHRLEVVLRVDLEGDVGVGLDDPWHLGEPGGHDVGDLFVILDPDDHDEIELPGYRVRLRDAWHIGEGRPELRDGRPFRFDQDNRGDHEGILSSRLAA